MKDHEKGSVLVLVMMSVVALLVLGTALAATGSTEIRETARQEQKMQAFYLARSGVEAITSSIIREPAQAEEITGQGFSEPVELGGGTFQVKVEPEGELGLLVTALGRYGRAEESVTALMEKTNVSLDVLFDRVIFSNGKLDISHNNAHAYGDVESAGAIEGEPEEGYHAYPNSKRVYPSPKFPTDIPPTDDTIGPGYIDGDHHYKEIDLGPGETLTVFTGGQDIRVVAEVVNLWGELEIIKEGGKGRLLLFVTEEATFQTPHSSTNPVDSLVVFMQDNSTVTFRANSTFRGYVYGPKATVFMNSKDTTVRGAIIADRVVKNTGNITFQGNLIYHEEVAIDPNDFANYIFQTTTYQVQSWR